MRSAQTWGLFGFVVVLTLFAVMAVWPSYPERYLPGDFWPSGRGVKIGGWERETMRLGLDLRGGAQLVLEADPPEDYEGDLDAAMDVAREVIERRVNEFGVSEAEIQQTSGNRLTVQIPGMPLADAERLIGQTAQLEFRVYNDLGELVPATGVVDGQTLTMTGQYLKNNTFPSRSGTTFLVNFETTDVGAKLMEQITTRALQYPQQSLQNQLLIFLDNELISNAAVNGVISDAGVITGQESFTAASDFSKQLNAGALPVPLRTIQSNEVSATLGEDSVVDSVHAGEIGLIAVALFMILMYRLPGLLAAAALGVYTALTLMVFKTWPVTLTLSGIAAFVLSVGMAVDANILIFERMKEELRRGRTLNSAIDIGFARAWTSIRDSNVSTLITCLILYWFGDQFGASLVKGFALTLAIGVAVSMFSAITVTRTFLKMVVGTRLAKNHWLFNAEERKHEAGPATVASRRTWIDFAGKRWWTLGLSLVIFLAAAVTLAIPPSLKAGIEFTSGSSFTLKFEQPVEQGELRTAMGDLGHPEARVQGAGDNTYLIRTEELAGTPALDADSQGPVQPGELDEIEAGLAERFGPLERQDFSTVSGTVSSEIARNATLAVIVAAVAILLYIAIVFRQLPNPWKYGAAAVVALLPDAFIILGLFSLMGKLFDTEVDTAFITAILTVIGFSVHDTIVVFDRIRERLSHDAFLPFDEAVNASLTETLARSINTSLVVVLTVVSMLLIGGVTIQNFLIVLLVGIISGTYSSVGVAAQILVAWEKRDISRLFRRGTRDSRGDAEMDVTGDLEPAS
ncbi:MAG TPA: protein translocase subunit SecD [Tepidiformaceae bacterium]|nr:protein translocase subunit SecD [Tepidiformaceae bacterium]